MSTDKYETLNQERYSAQRKKQPPTAVFPRAMKTRPIHLKAKIKKCKAFDN